jgi:initiation factor 1A
MVKNIGGNKAKRQGRKHTQGSSNHTTRKATSDDELYSIVTKICGNGRVEVKSIDNVTRIMIIRKKFKGRNKRDNMISLNTWVLVGLRSWEVRRADDKENCDLLEVYNSNDINELKQSVDASWMVLTTVSRTNQSDEGGHSEINFVDERTQKYEDLLDSSIVCEGVKESLDWLADATDSNDSDIDVDDI